MTILTGVEAWPCILVICLSKPLIAATVAYLLPPMPHRERIYHFCDYVTRKVIAIDGSEDTTWNHVRRSDEEACVVKILL